MLYSVAAITFTSENEHKDGDKDKHTDRHDEDDGDGDQDKSKTFRPRASIRMMIEPALSLPTSTATDRLNAIVRPL